MPTAVIGLVLVDAPAPWAVPWSHRRAPPGQGHRTLIKRDGTGLLHQLRLYRRLKAGQRRVQLLLLSRHHGQPSAGVDVPVCRVHSGRLPNRNVPDPGRCCFNERCRPRRGQTPAGTEFPGGPSPSPKSEAMTRAAGALNLSVSARAGTSSIPRDPARRVAGPALRAPAQSADQRGRASLRLTHGRCRPGGGRAGVAAVSPARADGRSVIGAPASFSLPCT